MPELPDVIVPESSFDWYQSHEASQLLAAARDGWARTVLLFALHTGARMASSALCGGRTSTQVFDKLVDIRELRILRALFGEPSGRLLDGYLTQYYGSSLRKSGTT
jgi:hypothetical protein